MGHAINMNFGVSQVVSQLPEQTTTANCTHAALNDALGIKKKKLIALEKF
jgi:hypothetical protein